MLLLLLFAWFSGFSQSEEALNVESGKASYYSDKLAGRRTSSGERYNVSQLTAAHKTLPFGTLVRVINIKNGKSVIVKINDRGPYSKGRIIDLSKKAAQVIDIIKVGVGEVKIEYPITKEKVI